MSTAHTPVAQRRRDQIAAAGLAIGGLAGMAGSFVGHEHARHILWMIDGAGLVVAAALLAAKYFRQEKDGVAAGFLVFLAGQTLVISGAPASLQAGNAAVASGISLWAVALVMIASTSTFPRWSRVTGVIAAALFTVSAVHISLGGSIVATSAPLPSAGYPFLVLTMAGWIRTLLGRADRRAIAPVAATSE